MYSNCSSTPKRIQCKPEKALTHESMRAQVVTAAGEVGVIQGAFGKSGKFKVDFPDGVQPPAPGAGQLTLVFKKYVYDADKRMVQ